MGKTCSECGNGLVLNQARQLGITAKGYYVCTPCFRKPRPFVCTACGNVFTDQYKFFMPKCPSCGGRSHTQITAAPEQAGGASSTATPPSAAKQKVQEVGQALGGLVVILAMILGIRSCVCSGRSSECQKADPCFDQCVRQFGHRAPSPNVEGALGCIRNCEQQFGVKAEDCPK